MQPKTITPNEILNYLLAGAVLVSAAFVALALYGYGKLDIKHFGTQNVYVNGHHVKDGVLKVRPGIYRVRVETPRYATYEVLASVGLFKTSAVTPAFEKRSPNDIVSSVIGAFGQYGPPEISDPKWFLQDTWLAGILGPGDSAPIALHFTDSGWHVAYYDVSGYQQDIKKTPAIVQAYLASQNRVTLQ
jgi:hypothetical protein